MKAVVAAFNQEKALVGAFSVITNLRMQLFEALLTLLPPLTCPRPTAARPSAAACRWRSQCRTSSRTWPQQRVRRGPPLLGEAHLWSLMMSEDPEASGIGLPSLSIFIQRIGYSVAHSTEQSMSMVELLCRYSVDMVDILWIL